jgi:hypothetical protein
VAPAEPRRRHLVALGEKEKRIGEEDGTARRRREAMGKPVETPFVDRFSGIPPIPD